MHFVHRNRKASWDLRHRHSRVTLGRHRFMGQALSESAEFPAISLGLPDIQASAWIVNEPISCLRQELRQATEDCGGGIGRCLTSSHDRVPGWVIRPLRRAFPGVNTRNAVNAPSA